jgi:hypothetical protein
VRYLLLAAVCLALAGCTGSSGSRGGASHESLTVYEAALRHQLKGYSPETRAYLSIDGRDIPMVLLTKLRSDWPNVQHASDAGKDEVLHVYAESLKWDGLYAAEVRAGYRMPTKYAGQMRFGDLRIVYKDGRWVVESVSNDTIGCG